VGPGRDQLHRHERVRARPRPHPRGRRARERRPGQPARAVRTPGARDTGRPPREPSRRRGVGPRSAHLYWGAHRPSSSASSVAAGRRALRGGRAPPAGGHRALPRRRRVPTDGLPAFEIAAERVAAWPAGSWTRGTRSPR
jgi:hypothetical protein